jgi:hypothetical protein
MEQKPPIGPRFRRSQTCRVGTEGVSRDFCLANNRTVTSRSVEVAVQSLLAGMAGSGWINNHQHTAHLRLRLGAVVSNPTLSPEVTAAPFLFVMEPLR